jgi:hypothetical protein
MYAAGMPIVSTIAPVENGCGEVIVIRTIGGIRKADRALSVSVGISRTPVRPAGLLSLLVR